MRERFFWLGMAKDIQKWTRACHSCQIIKGMGKHTTRMSLKTEEVTRPMQRVGVDVLGPWPMTASGNRFIIIYQDYFSKWVEIFAARHHTAHVVAEILVKEIISRYGTMERLHSDQGREFESQIYQEVCRMWDIKKTRTSPYTAWSNGQVERINATVKTMVKHYVDSAQNTWDRFLHYLRMAYNFTEHKSTKCTPFRLFFSRCTEPTVPLDLVYGTQKPEERQKCKQLYCMEQEVKSRKIFDIVRQNLETSVSASQKYYNRRGVKERVYRPGELVLREYPPLSNTKLGPKYEIEPYVVMQMAGSHTVEIVRNGSPKIVHANCLKPYMTQTLECGYGADYEVTESK